MKFQPSPRVIRQRGIALLLLFAVLFMASASLFLTYTNTSVLRQQQNSDDLQELRRAKEALIAYAVMHGDYYGPAGGGPGHLPCPDTNGNGQENTPCGMDALGWLPISVTAPSAGNPIIELSDYGMGTDQVFWYALIDSARRNPVSAFNTSTAGTLTINGQPGMAAVLIAPGEAVGSQIRPSTNDANYLEVGNAGGPDFVSGIVGSETNNDRVLGIHVSEIMFPVTARIADTIRTELEAWHTANGEYPDAGDFNSNPGGALEFVPAWFTTNNWLADTSYTKVDADNVTLQFNGCLNSIYTIDNVADTMIRTGTQC